DLKELDRIPEQIKTALSSPEILQDIADRGRILAEEGHTWDKRAETLHRFIENDLNPTEI
ncbi:MAG: glycosyltransferase, partial [Lachnospiraceae bacterium]|nr:glycosyltransferase [Lachnospiraceae bacterium]